MTGERVQARVFGEVAEEYDRFRPDYPDALVDDVLTAADLGGAPALEVGAGTGKATLAFARRGVAVTAVEPDRAMAELLTRRTAAHPGVTVVVAAFEEHTPPEPCGLLFSGQAWHWVDPAVRWRRAAEALAPGGTLALFWNNDRFADPAVADAVQRAHLAHAPQTAPPNDVIDEAGLVTAWPYLELAAQPDFGEIEPRLYRWTREQSRDDYLACLATQSPYLMLDADTRAALFAALVDALPGRVRLDGATILYLARRLGQR